MVASRCLGRVVWLEKKMMLVPSWRHLVAWMELTLRRFLQ